MTSPKRVPMFELSFTEAVCNVLAQTGPPGLTNGELLSALRGARVDGLDLGPNKRTQLLTTLHNKQVAQGCGNVVVNFVNAAMNPTRYVQDPKRHAALQQQLNAVLILFGMKVNDAGKLAKTATRAATISEAARLAGALQVALNQRGCHQALLAYCDEELLAQSLFHAVSEAAKSIPDRIRRHTGRSDDGDDLYTDVFGSKTRAPTLVIGAYVTESDISEHRGFKNLLLGIHGHYRNPRAHATRLGSQESEQDFLDAFGLFSYVHRRLDGAGVGP